MARERMHTDEREAPAARRAGGLELARSAARLGEQLPARARQLLSLQQSAGNRAVSRLVQRWRDGRGDVGLPQGRLAPVQRQGPEEEEPLQGRFATVQLQGLEDEEEPLQGRFEPVQLQGLEDEELQLKAAPSAPAQREPESVPRRNDTGLPDGLKSGVESLSGISLDEVEVHYNSAQPARLNALAYTQGSDIHVAPGQEQHLPHEAWHVIQQAQGRVQPTMQLQDVPVNDDEGLEQEADAMGAKAVALSSGPLPVQRAAVLGGPAVVQRALGVNSLLAAADVKNVKRIPGKLVYILTGHGPDSVVVKFEMPGGKESVAELGARQKALYDLARAVLEHVPEARVMTGAELTVLQQLDPHVVTGDVGDLVDVLQKGIGQASVPLKMEAVNVGDSLQDMIQNRTVTPSLLSATVLRQLGKMAFFDLLVSNTDRFQSTGNVNVQNIDFTAGGTEALPLDNLDPFGGGIPMSLKDYEGRASLVSRAARRDYAENALSTIVSKTKQMVSLNEVKNLIAMFAAGMEEAARLCKARQKGLEAVAFGHATMGTPAGNVAEGLAVRLNTIKV